MSVRFSRTVWLLVVLVALSTSTSRAASLDFRLSKVHALLNFAETATGEPHRSVTLLEHFEKSALNNAKTRETLKRFKAVYQGIGGSYEFQGFPFSRRQGASVGDLLLIQSALSKDLNDFETRTVGIMPISAQRELFAALRALEPEYDRYIWQPSLKKLEQKRKRLVQLADTAKLNELFSQAVHFYRSEWPKDRAFVIALYPIPGREGHSSAQSLDSVESVGLLTDETDDIGRFGILFHEICHSLYNAQSPAFQAEFERWFADGKIAFGNLTYHRINEALATALGNGLAFERASGKVDPKSWYNDRYIEGLARGIYPMVKEYVSKKKSIDRSFVQESIAVFAQSFPDAPFEYDNLFNRMVMLIDNDGLSHLDIRERLIRNFRVSSESIYSGIDDPSGLQEIRKTSDTAIVVVSRRSLDKLSALTSVAPGIEKHLAALKDHPSPYVFWMELAPGRSIFVLSGEKTSDFVTLLDSMKKVARVKPKANFQTL